VRRPLVLPELCHHLPSDTPHRDLIATSPHKSVSHSPAVINDLETTVDITLSAVADFNDALIQDDVDQYPTFVLFTPALGRRFGQCCSSGASLAGLQLKGGSREVPAVVAKVERALPGTATFGPPDRLFAAEAKAGRAIKPDSIALGAFGGIVALAAFVDRQSGHRPPAPPRRVRGDRRAGRFC
jgi:hypothetical protein